METLVHDIKFGFRQMLKNPGFAAIALLSLALGIGANSAIFSLVNTVLLRPLPVEKPGELVSVFGTTKSVDFDLFSYPNYTDYRDKNEVFSGLLAFRFVTMSLGQNGQNERTWGYLVSGNYFDVLGVKPALGRTFVPDEDRIPNASPVAVISHKLWERRFNSDPKLIGTNVVINGETFTVIGVAPKGFSGTEIVFQPDVWVPMMMQTTIERGGDWLNDRGSGMLEVVGRLKPGYSESQAVASLNTLAASLGREYPSTNKDQTIVLSSPGLILPSFRNGAIVFAAVLMVVVGLVLLIACTNLANLLLAKASSRRKEIGIRLALGANRSRLVRQLLTESVMLSIIGGALGILLAIWIQSVFLAFKPPIDFPVNFGLAMDYRVLGFAALLSVVTGFLFGIVPALQSTSTDLIPSLKDEASAFRRSRLRNALVVTQIALSLVLLISTGLIVRSLQHAQSIDVGFNPENAVKMSFDLGLQGYDKTRGQAFCQQLIDRVSALPGIKSVTLANFTPFDLNESSTSVYIEGVPTEKSANRPYSLYSNVGVGYFQTMGIPVVQGRDFTNEDREGTTQKVIINEAFAKKFWPGQNPIGKRMSFSEGTDYREVIGIVRNGKYGSLTESPRPFVYRPLLQNYDRYMTIIARTTSDPHNSITPIRHEIQTLDENMPVFDVRTLAEHLGISLFPARIAATLLGAFGLLALLLAGIGIYGVMSFSVAQRTREIGIRVALGADQRSVLSLITWQGMKLAVIGVIIGLAIAFVVTQFMTGLLYGISPTDPITFSLIPLILGAVALLACYIPAQRATKVDPMVAIRYE